MLRDEMKVVRRHSIEFALVALVLLAGGAMLKRICFHERTFGAIGNLTRIEIENRSKPIGTITDPTKIHELVAFLDAGRTGWGGLNNAFGIPVPPIVAHLYDGDTLKANVGIGDGFLEMEREGDFASRPASGGETQEFLRILGLPAVKIKELPMVKR